MSATRAEPMLDDSWRIWRQANDVSVSYQRVKKSGALAIKAQLNINNTTPESALNFISQIDHIQQWMAFLDKAEVVAHHGQTQMTTLFEFKAVWPLSARQMVLTSEFQFTDTGFKIVSVDQQDKYTHLLNETIVSVPYSIWLLTDDKTNKSRTLTYTSITHLNGDAPAMLTNKILLRSMWQSFNNLKALIGRKG
ncbi:hypothetical protein [Catenovulum adriaticum]|uniref:START domain-containing protein n=1 Tax=Catenovulum adriaticum TaxID=2984846 RepID=A0ABY7ANT1_9ALTE|nr:hypothetical protein [Catenovulum sp. TS8]WAJ70883.1 hypothetical protein OLW01_03475 [Catenovulum sp. TS8]